MEHLPIMIVPFSGKYIEPRTPIAVVRSLPHAGTHLVSDLKFYGDPKACLKHFPGGVPVQGEL